MINTATTAQYNNIYNLIDWTMADKDNNKNIFELIDWTMTDNCPTVSNKPQYPVIVTNQCSDPAEPKAPQYPVLVSNKTVVSPANHVLSRLIETRRARAN